MHTGFVDEHLASLLDAPLPSAVVAAAAAFARSAPQATAGAGGRVANAPDPWTDLKGWGRS